MIFPCEMANKYKEETLLPMNIWIDDANIYLNGGSGKRIWFQLNKADELEDDNTGSMDLDGHIYPPNLKLEDQELRALRNFVSNNRYALERIADQEIRLYRIWPYILKGGEIASEEEVKALKGKVDQQVLEKKSTHKNEK